MNTFELSEKNILHVGGMIKKFFNKHKNFIAWHQFNCGMKKRIGYDINIRMPGDTEDMFVSTNRKVCNIECKINKNCSYPISIGYIDNYEEYCGFGLKVGDKVSFIGNRIMFRTKEPFGNGKYRYLYQCYQIV